MAITRVIVAGMFSLAFGIATFDPVHALSPCCGWRNGVYMNFKTGEPVPPPTIQPTPPKTGSGSGSPGCGTRLCGAHQ